MTLVDDSILKREQSKQEMTVGGHWSPPVDLGRAPAPVTIVRRPAHDLMKASIAC
jgi:hypothetical protein